ncbi:MAG: aldo/keto reductase [Phycisphaeraceae bacterium]|nr:aldo/keto reductase [Phycisphaeraceae bacterium]
MTTKLQWGILATGNIAKAFAKGLAASKSSQLVAVGSRDIEKARAFAKEFNVPTAHGSYEALLADPKVQAVYISTPHPQHAQWAIKAAQAGKHILCEKPIGLNHPQAMAIVEAARIHKVFLMEAFMYRCHPQTAKLVELVQSGIIGSIHMIQATFSFRAGPDPNSRLMNNKLAGGGILDVGCYCTSLSRLIAGAAADKPFVEPISVVGAGYLGATNVDEYAAAVLKFPPKDKDSAPIIAQVATGVRLNQDNSVRIYGSEGSIVVPNAWIPAREGGAVKIIVNAKGKTEEIEVQTDQYLYGLEADTVAKSLPNLQAASPAMSWDDTLGNMKALDLWRQAIGLVYEDEKPEVFVRPLHGGALAAQAGHPMKYGTIPGLNKPVSRLIMGCDNQPNFSHAAVMFDDWFERGGNAFDTAWVYGGGTQERLLGQWIKARGIRDKVALIVKGAHSPYCNPKDMTKHLQESFDRLGMAETDIYIMHRDNPQIPVGEFVDWLNDQVKAGRFKAFGGSNWTTARMQEANEWAAKHGKIGFSILSNNFSLARMIDPVWAGCIAASDADSRAWLKKSQIALLAWSSQARGFFTDRAHPDKRDDAEMVRCWYSPDNFQRRQRAIELAQTKGVLPINIAAAYVLNQPFPNFALIGPRVLNETTTSLPALDVTLTEQELKWLNLEA